MFSNTSSEFFLFRVVLLFSLRKQIGCLGEDGKIKANFSQFFISRADFNFLDHQICISFFVVQIIKVHLQIRKYQYLFLFRMSDVADSVDQKDDIFS